MYIHSQSNKVIPRQSFAALGSDSDGTCESAKQFYRTEKIEKERFDACERENDEFWRRVGDLDIPYKKSKLNVDSDKAESSLWSEKCVSHPELYEPDIDHKYCKCCGLPTRTIKRRYQWKDKHKQRKEGDN
jgi:hypothetical protein